ncbi:MAG TPA: PQQ-dependent dehydrogenase, methanol/ethanol family [Bryobacteraceae bacterium]|nr:PQQ-dependent dehydrogenase, methanol/ethanol family [Bryobacteraceae bacterium]
MKTVLLLSLALMMCRAYGADITFENLIHAQNNPAEWLTYWGDYHATRFRNLKQINDGNVGKLRLEWMFQTNAPGAFETVPLVADGVMYFTTPDATVDAIDARSGRQLWRYQYHIPKAAKYCCGMLNRGLAMLGDRLYYFTPDARLLAIDRRNGLLLWNTEVASSAGGSYGGTEAPLVVKDKVILGPVAGDYGIRGSIEAFDANTGKRVWRFRTIPMPGEPGNETWSGDSWKHGGGSTWMTGTYDAESNTIFWGIGNPAPDLVGSVRLGDNLYTDSVVALDADTGKMKWYFQFTPHDTYDYDATETPMLLDLPWQGKSRKLLVQANRNGFFYVLDRETGEFLSAKAFVKTTWATGIDSKGRPIRVANLEPTEKGTVICPQCSGATNWMAPSYSPLTRLFYVNVREGCDIFFSKPPVYKEGTSYWATSVQAEPQERQTGRVTAIDPLTGEMKWKFPLYSSPWAGTLATAGNLVFAGDEDGYLMALQADTGKLLWRVNTGSRLVTSPITYELDGKQYVTMPSGGAVLTFALPVE